MTSPNKLEKGIDTLIAAFVFRTLITGISADTIEINEKIAHIFNLYFCLTNSVKIPPNNNVKIASIKCSIISPTS